MIKIMVFVTTKESPRAHDLLCLIASSISDSDDDIDYITIEDDEDEDDVFALSPATPPRVSPPLPENFEIPGVTHSCGTIRAGDVVELIDHTEREPAALQSGDFLLVRAIIEDVATEEVKLRGYRLRRCKCYQPMFEGK